MDFSKIEKNFRLTIDENNARVLIFSDLHFYKHRNSPIFLNIVEKILKSIVGVVDKCNIKTIFFLGDWFHKKEKVGTEELVITSKFLYSLKERNVNIIMFVGNHDFLYKDETQSEQNTIEFFNILPNTYIVSDYNKAEFGNKSIHFFRWSDSLRKNFVLSKIDQGKDNYFFGHIELNNYTLSKDYTFHSFESEIDVSFLNKYFKKSFLGHYHTLKSCGNVIVVGSPYQNNFGEAGNKNGFFLFDFKTDAIEFIRNDLSPNFIKMPLSDYKIDTEEDLNEININNSFIRIILDKKMSPDLLTKLKDKLNKTNYLVEMVFSYEDKNETNITNDFDDNMKKKLLLMDFDSHGNVKNFFKVYLDMFKDLPEPLDKNKLNKIIEDIII